MHIRSSHMPCIYATPSLVSLSPPVALAGALLSQPPATANRINSATEREAENERARGVWGLLNFWWGFLFG